MNRKACLAVIAVLVLTACGGEAITGTPIVAGSFTLITIGGQPLPFTFPPNSGDQTTTRVDAGNITINADGSFSEAATLTVTTVSTGQATTTSNSCVGTYTQSGNTIFFSEPNNQANPVCGGATFVGSWNGNNSLTLQIDVGVNAVFTLPA